MTSLEATAFKKSEINSRDLPDSEIRRVSKGSTVKLASPPTSVDEDYWLVTLVSLDNYGDKVTIRAT